MKLRNHTIVALMLALFTTRPLWAQTAPTWNRKVEAISVLPAPVEGGGFQSIRAYFSVEADALSAPEDLSTEILILINGTAVDLQQFDASAQPAGDNPCLDECSTTCVCPCNPPPCGQVCTCGRLIFLAPLDTSLQPEDEIMVLLRPSPGALPENEQADDQLAIVYHGDDLYWNRRLSSVRITPTAGAPDSFFDISTEVIVEANYEGTFNPAAELALIVNGVEVATSPVPALDLDLQWNPCADVACDDTVACVINPDPLYLGTCQPDDDTPSCTCQYHPVPDEGPPSFAGIPLDPDDELSILLRPVPGALPELPGFGDDDERPGQLPCPADSNGDGTVNVDDLTAVILDWGTDGSGHGGDINGDGIVDVDDLTLVILAWGVCNPV